MKELLLILYALVLAGNWGFMLYVYRHVKRGGKQLDDKITRNINEINARLVLLESKGKFNYKDIDEQFKKINDAYITLSEKKQKR